MELSKLRFFSVILCFMMCLLFIQCNHEKGESISDSLYIRTLDVSEHVKEKMTVNFTPYQGVIENKFIIRLLNYDDESYFFIKEFNSSGGINRYFYKYNKWSRVPNYDSILHDRKCIEKGYFNHLSAKYYKIPELREQDVMYMKDSEISIKKNSENFESIINEMDFFQDFEYANRSKLSLLLKLLILTQIQVLNVPSEYTDLMIVMNLTNILIIKSEKDLKEFKNILEKDSSVVLFNESRVKNIYKQKGATFLLQQINIIENNYSKDNVYYVFCTSDYKMFEITLIVKENKLRVELKYLNPAFLWSEYNFPFTIGSSYY